MEVLIVDDNAVKSEKIKSILDDLKIPSESTKYAGAAIDAKSEMMAMQYDVLVLDLVLPLRRDDPPQKDGGINLLKEMVSLRTIKVPRKIYILSEFDTALEELQQMKEELPLSPIKYENDSNEWITTLKNYLSLDLRIQTEQREHYDYDAAIICALDNPELEEVRKLPIAWNLYNIFGDSTDYYTGIYNGKRVVCAASYEMGLSSAAILSTKLITLFRPKYLIMTGIAGGVDRDSLNYGDIMIADPCFDYESGKRVNEGGANILKPDYRQVRLDDSALQAIRRIAAQKENLKLIHDTCTYTKPDEIPEIKIGFFGSGAAVLSDKKIIEEVLGHTRKFLGFDMEAYSVMLSGALATRPKPVTVVMKSVSDFGDGKTDQYQKYAAYTSAKVLLHFLDEVFD